MQRKAARVAAKIGKNLIGLEDVLSCQRLAKFEGVEVLAHAREGGHHIGRNHLLPLRQGKEEFVKFGRHTVEVGTNRCHKHLHRLLVRTRALGAQILPDEGRQLVVINALALKDHPLLRQQLADTLARVELATLVAKYENGGGRDVLQVGLLIPFPYSFSHVI